MSVDLTVFVSTYNRTTTLALCLEALAAQTHPHELVLVDNGSDWPPACDYLDELGEQHRTYRLAKVESMDALTRNISLALRGEWKMRPHRHWYAVMDADVCLDGPADSLDTYIRLATARGYAVGPHLRLNTHRNYPLRSRVLVEQSRDLYKLAMLWHDDIPYSILPIDSSFLLFPSAPRFRRLKMETLRVGAPWWATHLDWTVDVIEPDEENFAYIHDPSVVGSWGKSWIRGVFDALQESPEAAFALFEHSPNEHDDYFVDGFILSWMLQHGHGCEIDLERSAYVLRHAVPSWSPCLLYENDWKKFVYDDDCACLGWGQSTPRRPRMHYVHEKDLGGCGQTSALTEPQAERLAAMSSFYTHAYCATCREHRPSGADGEFRWVDATGKVGT